MHAEIKVPDGVDGPISLISPTNLLICVSNKGALDAAEEIQAMMLSPGEVDITSLAKLILQASQISNCELPFFREMVRNLSFSFLFDYVRFSRRKGIFHWNVRSISTVLGSESS